LVQKIYKGKQNDAEWEKKVKKIFKFTNDLVSDLKGANYLDLTFRLYLECAIAAGKCDLNAFAYGFINKGALTMYEEDIAKNNMEYSSIRLLIANMKQINCFDRDQYTKLSKRIAQHSSKLVNTDDQSHAVAYSAHLFHNKIVADDQGAEYRDNGVMLSCLKKAHTIASEIPDHEAMVASEIEVLDNFLYYFDHYPDVVEAKHVITIINKVKKDVQTKAPDKDQLQHIKNIKSYIAFKQNPKKVARGILENLEQEYYAQNPLPGIDMTDKSKVEELKKAKEQIRNKLKPKSEELCKAPTEHWKEISFQ